MYFEWLTMSILFFVRCWTIGNYGHEMFPWLNQIWDLLGPAVLEKKKKNYVICVILCIFSWNNLNFYVNYVFHVILLPRKQLLRSFWTNRECPKKKVITECCWSHGAPVQSSVAGTLWAWKIDSILVTYTPPSVII